ncbi:MAG: PilN domain-containing protein [Candidatus Firestonebacteria bacterium]
MIEINLLPDSYFKAKRKKQIIAAITGGVILFAVILVGLYLFTLMNVARISGEIKKVEEEQAKIKNILEEINNINRTKSFVQERIGVINELLDSQTIWFLLLDNFNKCIPSNIWLSSLTNKMEASGFRTFTVDGISLFKESVADFIFNLNQPNGMFKNASLITLIETVVSGKNVYSFKLTFQSIEEIKIKPPKEVGMSDVSKTGIYGNTYVNTDYKCSIFSPEGWTMKEDNTASVLITKEKREVSEKFTPSIGLIIAKLKSNVLPQEYFKNIEKNYKKLFKNYKELSQKEITINSLKCFEVVFNWQTKSKDGKGKWITLRQKQVYYIKDIHAYVLTFTDVDDKFKSNLDDFNIIMNSFKVM